MLLDMFLDRRVPYVFAVAVALGVVLAAMLTGVYQRYMSQMLRGKENGRGWYVKMRNRFEDYYKQKVGVADVGLFVKSQMEAKRYGILRLRTWERLVMKFPFLCIGGGVLAALYASAQHFSADYCLELLGYGVVAAVICHYLQQLFHVGGNRCRVEVAYTEQFTNVLRPLLERQYREKRLANTSLTALTPRVNREEKRNAAEYAALTEEVSIPTNKNVNIAENKNSTRVEQSKTKESETDAKLAELEEARLEEQRMARLEEIRLRQEKRKQERMEKEERERQLQAAKEEKERQHQQQKLLEKRRKEEQRAREKQAALQNAYEEKQRKLREKYLSKMKEECAVSSETVMTQDPDFIEDVLKEFLP